jgi:hypothetical protein
MSRFLLASVRWVSAVEPFFCRLRRGGEEGFLKKKMMYMPFPGIRSTFYFILFCEAFIIYNFKEYNSRWGRFYEEENFEIKYVRFPGIWGLVFIFKQIC